MAVLIDSGVLMRCLKGELQAPSGDQEFFLSIISADELLRSIEKARDSTTRTRRLAWVEAALELFPVLPIDRTTVRLHAQILSELEAGKKSIGTHESWIAATCIAHGLTLLTTYPEAFKNVPGLMTLDCKPAAS